MKKYAVTALGELLIDFTENGMSNQNNPLFDKDFEDYCTHLFSVAGSKIQGSSHRPA